MYSELSSNCIYYQFLTSYLDLNQDRRLDGKEVASTDIDAPWMNKMRKVDRDNDGSISHPELKEYLMKETKSSNNAKNANILCF